MFHKNQVARWQTSAITPCKLTLFWNLLLQLLLLLLNVLISFGDPLLECSDLRTLGKNWNYIVVRDWSPKSATGLNGIIGIDQQKNNQ